MRPAYRTVGLLHRLAGLEGTYAVATTAPVAYLPAVFGRPRDADLPPLRGEQDALGGLPLATGPVARVAICESIFPGAMLPTLTVARILALRLVERGYVLVAFRR